MDSLTNCLGNSHCGPKGSQLDSNKEQNTRFPNFAQRFISGREGIITEEINQFSRDTVPFKGISTHVPTMHVDISHTNKLPF